MVEEAPWSRARVCRHVAPRSRIPAGTRCRRSTRREAPEAVWFSGTKRQLEQASDGTLRTVLWGRSGAARTFGLRRTLPLRHVRFSAPRCGGHGRLKDRRDGGPNPLSMCPALYLLRSPLNSRGSISSVRSFFRRLERSMPASPAARLTLPRWRWRRVVKYRWSKARTARCFASR